MTVRNEQIALYIQIVLMSLLKFEIKISGVIISQAKH